ncbi:outer membrane protein [Orrella daihaiensis]|uniref:Outer membrane beta-barrel protein n=1 Tax=Orrella daihaiensis TaxID=2782176 RepID=A0ABY4ATI9_9BURK|nr:outer membrane beta-barrel protein [Orrella daihaiensis]UOD51364.1 outer membrane beta-barrel protein [Orrella daihaiensis]
MLTLRHCVLFAGLAAASSVAAQPSKFQGAFGQIGIGYESVSPTHDSSTLSVNNVSIPVSTTSNSTSNATGTISIGWYQSINDRFLLGLGVEYSPFAGSSGDMYVTTARALPGQNNVTNDYKYQKKDSYNIFLSPAVAVGTDGLAYAKIGYTGAKVTNYNSLTYNFKGYSLGLGYKHIFQGGWYGFIEGNYFNYGNQTESATNTVAQGRTLTSSGTNGLTSYNILVGVGYKF